MSFPRSLRAFLIGSALALLLAPLSAQEFVAQLSAEERVILRIGDMTPAQLEALEAAVRRYIGHQPSTINAAPANAAVLEKRLAEREAQLEQVSTELAETKTALQGKDAALKQTLGQLAKSMLGVRTDYANTESRLKDAFTGWRKGTIFQLENGQNWQVTEGDYWSRPQPAGKGVKILAGIANSYFMQLDGVRPQPRVVLIK